MSTKQFTPEKRKRPINGPHPTPLRIKQDSHSIRKPSFSSHEKQLYRATNAPSPKIIHTNTQDFKSLVQRLTGLNEEDKNGKRPMDDVVDHHYKGSTSFNPNSSLIDMSYPYLGHHDIPNSTNFSVNCMLNSMDFSFPPPVYTYAETISFPTLPNIGSSISPVKNEFLDIERIIGFGSLNERECWPWVFKGKKEVPYYGRNEGGQRLKQEEFVPRQSDFIS